MYKFGEAGRGEIAHGESVYDLYVIFQGACNPLVRVEWQSLDCTNDVVIIHTYIYINISHVCIIKVPHLHILYTRISYESTNTETRIQHVYSNNFFELRISPSIRTRFTEKKKRRYQFPDTFNSYSFTESNQGRVQSF